MSTCTSRVETEEEVRGRKVGGGREGWVRLVVEERRGVVGNWGRKADSRGMDVMLKEGMGPEAGVRGGDLDVLEGVEKSAMMVSR